LEHDRFGLTRRASLSLRAQRSNLQERERLLRRSAPHNDIGGRPRVNLKRSCSRRVASREFIAFAADAVSATLRAISMVATPCRSTAAAIAPAMALIVAMPVRFPCQRCFTASPPRWPASWVTDTCGEISRARDAGDVRTALIGAAAFNASLSRRSHHASRLVPSSPDRRRNGPRANPKAMFPRPM
jgi:hypothetical protein